MLLHGIFPPITTPFYPDGRVYLKKLEHNVERYSKTPVAGIVALGSTGEAIMLSDEERRDVLKVTREACAPHKVLIAGTGAESAIETLRLTEYAAELGYDAALVRTPFFYQSRMQPASMLAFYRTVADGSPIPVMIYNVPVFTKYDIPPELVAELAEHPNIVGIKESGGDVEKVRRMVELTRHIKRSATVTQTFDAVTPRMMMAETPETASRELVPVGALALSLAEVTAELRSAGPFDFAQGRLAGAPVPTRSEQMTSQVAAPAKQLKTRQKEVGFQILVGVAHKLLPSLEAGATGAILAFAAPAPTACYEIYAAWKEGDADLARLKQERIAGPSNRVAGELGIPALKYASDLNGYYGGPPRLPLLPLTGEQKAEVEQVMSDIRN
jgi:dihydrodipicolinate synthase/N-acetylneuraminate lyase